MVDIMYYLVLQVNVDEFSVDKNHATAVSLLEEYLEQCIILIFMLILCYFYICYLSDSV